MPGITPTALPDIFQIALPTPFQIGDVNTFLIEGDPLTLLDCGVNSDDSYAALKTYLGELGHSVEEIGQVIISHHHTDHMGAIERIVQASAAEVLAHPYTIPFLETPHAIRARNRSFTDVAFRQAGVPQHILDVLDEVDDYFESMMSSASVARTLDEGDTISVGARDWDIYHMPGHAGGMIVLFDPASRIMLASDHILAHISSNPLIEAPDPGQKRPRRLIDYMHHLRRAAGLNPSVAYTGHGDPVTNIRELVDKRLEMHRRRADKVLSLFEGEPLTLYDLTVKMFPRVPERESYLTLSEVLGHLDVLEVEGRVERDFRADGILYWKPAFNPVPPTP